MFVESKTIRKPVYRTKYVPGIGNISAVSMDTVQQIVDCYKCDHCGHKAECLRLIDPPTEPFYCAKCNHLVSIT